jgi:DNA-binding MarR family transcriptional regulator
MSARGLVERCGSETDRRATDAVLTDAGRAALDAATPGHAALVRRMFFDGLDDAQVPVLRAALEAIHEQVLRHGTLPSPEFQHRLPGLTADGGPHVSPSAGG